MSARLMTPTQIGDELTYSMYYRNRELGLSSQRLYAVFGQAPCEEMERRYWAESLTKVQHQEHVCGGCGRKVLGSCGNCAIEHQAEQRAAARGLE